MIKIKSYLYLRCLAFIEDRYKMVQNSILDIQDALHSETKSSAGDKHETGRAMLQLEREKLGFQLAEIQKTKEVLAKINTKEVTNKAGLGSLVITNKNSYFIAISAGELKYGDKIYYAISINTPIGSLLKGKKKGDGFLFNKQSYVINEIF